MQSEVLSLESYLGGKLRFYIKQIILFLFISISFLSCSNSQPTQPVQSKDRAAKWNEDLDFLSSQLKAKQISLFSIVQATVFNNEIKAIKDSINQLQDYEIILKIQQLMVSMGIAHTTVSFNSLFNFAHVLPISTYYFSDGLYITAASDGYSNLLGKKIQGVNGKDISVVVDSLKTIISHENDYWVKAILPDVFKCVEALRFFRIADTLSSVKLKVEGVGEVEVNSVQSGTSVSMKNVLDGVQLPLYIQNADKYYWYSYIENNKTIYLKYNSCQNMASQPFADFVNELNGFISAHTVRKFVLDVRDNWGGNASVINSLSNLSALSGSQNVKFYLVIGRQTFSAALINAITLKQNTNCVVVGEPTGGKPNCYGEAQVFDLPNSSIAIQYSTKYFEMIHGSDPASLFPDYNVDISYSDYAQGKDPVLDWILNN